MSKRLLVVDDEETLCEALRFNLEAEGYEVAVAHSAEEVLSMDISGFDLILLDIMMGEISGLQLARILKANPVTASVPVIFCTAKDAEDDMIEGLELGADDYIVKPYSLRNVMARVKTVLRRANPSANQGDCEKISFEGLTVIPSKKLCLVDGEEVRLPKKEFEILRKMLGNIGRVFTREELLREIWPEEVVVLDRVVDVNITRIRQKIGRYGSHIKTRSGYGYGFVD
ncbi:MAG: response regulator transcription factor [Duncaniella sp.]|uniref:response regulator transcription factor n=1 Tax=Duncaniella sp. TaxID=2518496 RepID=UPI0023C44759|nr:response regulator transcription factor [Duncaniella sp.]MDE5989759.1 response regulator transcription factor [Duncaniella sp.]